MKRKKKKGVEMEMGFDHIFVVYLMITPFFDENENQRRGVKKKRLVLMFPREMRKEEGRWDDWN